MQWLSDLIKAIREHDTAKLWVVIIVIAAMYLFPCLSKFQHQRYRLFILISLFLAGLIGTAYFKHFISHSILYCLIILWVFHFGIAFYSVKNPPFPETLKISGLEKLVREGRYTDIDRIYPEKPFYITSTSGKIKWALLNIRGFIEQEPPKLNDAYLACKHLLKLHLLEEEKNDIKLRQVLILLLLEDTKKAREFLKK